jgi:radical SAM protein with 4Fe4S-binding SPASM domain
MDFVDDKRFEADYTPVVDYSDCSHLVSDRTIINLVKHGIDKGIRFVPLRIYISPFKSFCYAIIENQYVIDVDRKISKCTCTNLDISFIGFLEDNGTLLLNDNNKLWLNARVSKKCNNCNYFSSCGGGACPLYYFKNNQARCMKFKNCMDELLKIIELQGHYDLTLSLEDK